MDRTRPKLGFATSLVAASTAPVASTSPSPPPTRYAAVLNAVPIRMPFTRFGVRFGLASYIRAAMPETTAPLCDVPVPLK